HSCPTDPRRPRSSPTRRSSDLNPKPQSRRRDVAEALATHVVERTGSRLGETVDLADVSGSIFSWPDASMTALNDRVAASDVVIVDRKSTRLNSSHVKTSYAVFC